MTTPTILSKPPRFWRTVLLLMYAAYRRSIGRRKRQKQLLHNRTKGVSFDSLGVIGWILLVLGFGAIQTIFAMAVLLFTHKDERGELERGGKIVESEEFYRAIEHEYGVNGSKGNGPESAKYMDRLFSWESERRSNWTEKSSSECEIFLRAAVRDHRTDSFIVEPEFQIELRKLATAGPVSNMLGSLILLWWLVTLICNGEGLELDFQRSRHPMWEWLLCHPVKKSAVFLAEMLSPIAANPIYLTAPVVPGVLFWNVYGFWLGVAAVIIVGVPVTVATASCGKALEISVILRFSSRVRGAMLGIINWIGGVGFFSIGVLFLPLLETSHTVQAILERFFHRFGLTLSWPLLRWMLGVQSDGTISFLRGVLFCLFVATLAIIAAVWFSAWAAQRGIAGNTGKITVIVSKTNTFKSNKSSGHDLPQN